MKILHRSSASTLVASACVLAVAAAPSEPTRAQDAARATRRVVVVVRNLRSDVGQVVAALYTSSRGWLEDDDGAFDRDFLGLPQEGYAFSNDAREPLGPPSFDAAAYSPPESPGFVVHARYGI